MVKLTVTKITWLPEPEEHNYPAAESYLSLLLVPDVVSELVGQLRKTAIASFKAKDVFRASKLSLLGVSNSHVQKNLEKIELGKKLSPILLVRRNEQLIIADGYHRLCAAYHFNEDTDVPCKIV